MTMEQLLAEVRTFTGLLELAPAAGGPFPEIAWGDHFFYYAPDGQVPQNEQPFATIVTKNYPDDALSDLDPPDRWRLNIHVGRPVFTDLTGEDPTEDTGVTDFAVADTVLPHPVYRRQGWICIITPGTATTELAMRLLRQAHHAAEQRSRRRAR